MAAPTINLNGSHRPTPMAPAIVALSSGLGEWRHLDNDFQWTASGSGTNEYYLETSGGGDPLELASFNLL